MSDHRFYEKDGIEYARVSTILGETMPIFHPSKHKGLAWWQETEPDAIDILERGQRRGTLIHSEVEMFLLGCDCSQRSEQVSMEELISYNIPSYVNFLIPLLQEIKSQNKSDVSWPGLSDSPLLIEREIFSSHGFAGKPDLRCWFEGKYTVWDWKSARSHLESGVQKKLRPISRYSEAKIQVSSYALAHNLELASTGDYPPVEQCAICICYDWCEPYLYLMTIKEIKDAVSEFIERFDAYKAIENSSFPRPLQSDSQEVNDDFSQF